MSEITNGPIYVTRGMKAKCSCSTAPKGQYLNIRVDHGVVAGADQQPVLNTNDHTKDTVFSFGNCTSAANPKLQIQAGILNFLVGGNPLNLIVKAVSGKGVVEHLSSMGIISCICEPDTPQVWQMGDEDHILDGAPILTKDSVLYCRNGGIITIMEDQESSKNSEQEEGQAAESQEADVVSSEAKEAFDAAMQKIESAGLPEMAAGDTVAGGGSGGAAGGSAGTGAAVAARMVAMAAMATYPASISSHVMPALGVEGLSADSCTPIHSDMAQRSEALAQNQNVDIPADALDGQGLITDISKLDEFKMFQRPASIVGGGAVAAYNAMKQLDSQSTPSFPQVMFDMETYGAVETPNGVFATGLSDYLAKQGCGVKFFLPGETVPEGQGVAIGLSLERGVMSYRTLPQDQFINSFSLMIIPKKWGVQNGTL